jgi:hypothetical protein
MRFKLFFSMLLFALLSVVTVQAQTVKGSDKVKAYEKTGGRTETKVPIVNDLQGNVALVTTDYTVKDMDRYLCIDSADSLLILTVPVNPGYQHRFFVNFTRGGSNNLILQGGLVDTLTSSQTKFYWFDLDTPGWRKFSW